MDINTIIFHYYNNDIILMNAFFNITQKCSTKKYIYGKKYRCFNETKLINGVYWYYELYIFLVD